MNTKLSEHIWAGAKMHPSIKVGWFGNNEKGEIQTCAIAAAMESLGLLVERDGTLVMSDDCDVVLGGVDRVTKEQLMYSVKPPQWFLDIVEVVVPLPCSCGARSDRGPLTFLNVIPHLHDVHQWTREATAMWVEKVEKEMEAKNEKAEKNPAPQTATTRVPDGEHLLVGEEKN